MKLVRNAAKLGALIALVNVRRNDAYDEVERVSLAGIPLFSRDEQGRPRVLGISFKRRRPRRGA